MRDYTELNKMVETGKTKIVKQLVEAAIAEGADPKEILEQGLLPGMGVIGEKFKNNEALPFGNAPCFDYCVDLFGHWHSSA